MNPLTILDVPGAVYAALRALLQRADCLDVIQDDADGEVIHLTGIALRSKAGSANTDITVSTLLSSRNQTGRIDFALNDELTQMDLDKAREIVGMLQGAIEAAISDELLFRFLTEKVELSPERAAGGPGGLPGTAPGLAGAGVSLMSFRYRGDAKHLIADPIAGWGDGDTYGAARLRSPHGRFLTIIFSGAEDCGWEHVSVSTRDQGPPNWDEMCFVKRLFWDAEDCVVQFHPPERDYVNNHPNCLHLWRWREGEFPRPAAILVGIREETTSA